MATAKLLPTPISRSDHTPRKATSASVAVCERGLVAGAGVGTTVDGEGDPLFGMVPRCVLRHIVKRSTREGPMPESSTFTIAGNGALVFVDVAGFTRELHAISQRKGVSSSIGAEEFSDRLSRVLSKFIDTIHSFGGDVISFIGDACLVAFGIDDDDTNSEDELAVYRAVQCAVRLVKESEERTEQESTAASSLGAGMRGLKVHVAVASGRFCVQCCERVGGAGGVRGFGDVVVAGDAMKALLSIIDYSPVGCVAMDASTRDVLLQKDSQASLTDVGNGGTSLFKLTSLTPVTNLSQPAGMNLTLPDGLDRDATLSRVRSQLECAWVHARGEILSRSALRKYSAEVRVMTVAFLLLGRSEEWSDVATSVGAARLLRVSTLLHEINAKFDGDVRKIINDDKGMVAMQIWGLPNHSHEDDAGRAMRAVIEQVRRVKETEGYSCHAGIATGHLYVGSVGSVARSAYDIIGSTANLAARMMSQRKGVLCDKQTIQLADAKSGAPCRAVETVALIKGIGMRPAFRVASDTGDVPVSESAEVSSNPGVPPATMRRRTTTQDRSLSERDMGSVLNRSYTHGTISSKGSGCPRFSQRSFQRSFGQSSWGNGSEVVGHAAERELLQEVLSSFLSPERCRDIAFDPTPTDEETSVVAPVLLLEAPSGMGKSHITMSVLENSFGDQVSAPIAFVSATSCDMYTSYGAIKDALWYVFVGDAAGLSVQDEARQDFKLVKNLVDTVSKHAPDGDPRVVTCRESLDFLAEALGVNVRTDVTQRVDSVKKVVMDFFGLWLDWRLEDVSDVIKRAPVLICVEDAHWLDLSSAELLLALHLENKRDVALMLNSRPEKEMADELKKVYNKCKALPECTEVMLKELPLDEMASMVDLVMRRNEATRAVLQSGIPACTRRMQGHPLPAVVYERLWELSAGVPQSILDACLALEPATLLRLVNVAAEGSTDEFDQAWSAAWFALQDGRNTEQGTGWPLQRAMIDHLPTADQMVLKVAAVIGPRFSVAALSAVFPEDLYTEIDIHASVDRLVKSNFIIPSRCIGMKQERLEGIFSFTHVSYLSTAYSMLGWSHRARVHMKVALLLEEPNNPMGLWGVAAVSTIAFTWGRALEVVDSTLDGNLGERTLGELKIDRLRHVMDLQGSASNAAFLSGSYTTAKRLYEYTLHTSTILGNILVKDSCGAADGGSPGSISPTPSVSRGDTISDHEWIRMMCMKTNGLLGTEFQLLVRAIDNSISLLGYSHPDTIRLFDLLESAAQCLITSDEEGEVSGAQLSESHKLMYFTSQLRRKLGTGQSGKFGEACDIGECLLNMSIKWDDEDLIMEATAAHVPSLMLHGRCREGTQKLRGLVSKLEERMESGRPLPESHNVFKPAALAWGYNALLFLFCGDMAMFGHVQSRMRWHVEQDPVPFQDSYFAGVTVSVMTEGCGLLGVLTHRQAQGLCIAGEYERARVLTKEVLHKAQAHELVMVIRHGGFVEACICLLSGKENLDEPLDRALNSRAFMTSQWSLRDSPPKNQFVCFREQVRLCSNDDPDVFEDASTVTSNLERVTKIATTLGGTPWLLYYPIGIRALIANGEYALAFAVLTQWNAKRGDDPGNSALISEQYRLMAELLISLRFFPSGIAAPMVVVEKFEAIREDHAHLYWPDILESQDTSDEAILTLLGKAQAAAIDNDHVVFELAIALTRARFYTLCAREVACCCSVNASGSHCSAEVWRNKAMEEVSKGLARATAEPCERGLKDFNVYNILLEMEEDLQARRNIEPNRE